MFSLQKNYRKARLYNLERFCPLGKIKVNDMEWYSFFEQRPLIGERILVIREWLDYDFKLNQSKRCWAIYECNFESVKRNIYGSSKRTVVNLTNLEQIAGKKFVNFFQSQYFDAGDLHWARMI